MQYGTLFQSFNGNIKDARYKRQIQIQKEKKIQKNQQQFDKNYKESKLKGYVLPCMLFVFDTSQLETSLLKTDAC